MFDSFFKSIIFMCKSAVFFVLKKKDQFNFIFWSFFLYKILACYSKLSLVSVIEDCVQSRFLWQKDKQMHNKYF